MKSFKKLKETEILNSSTPSPVYYIKPYNKSLCDQLVTSSLLRPAEQVIEKQRDKDATAVNSRLGNEDILQDSVYISFVKGLQSDSNEHAPIEARSDSVCLDPTNTERGGGVSVKGFTTNSKVIIDSGCMKNKKSSNELLLPDIKDMVLQGTQTALLTKNNKSTATAVTIAVPLTVVGTTQQQLLPYIQTTDTSTADIEAPVPHSLDSLIANAVHAIIHNNDFHDVQDTKVSIS